MASWGLVNSENQNVKSPLKNEHLPIFLANRFSSKNFSLSIISEECDTNTKEKDRVFYYDFNIKQLGLDCSGGS